MLRSAGHEKPETSAAAGGVRRKCGCGRNKTNAYASKATEYYEKVLRLGRFSFAFARAYKLIARWAFVFHFRNRIKYFTT